MVIFIDIRFQIDYFCRKNKMLPLFITEKIYKSLGSSGKISSLAGIISVAGITLGITVILISFAVIQGFKGEIKSKIYGFCSDLRLTSLDYSTSYETSPVTVPDSTFNAMARIPGVSHVQRYSTKPGIIKTADNFDGIVLKGIDSNYYLRYLESVLQEGRIPDYSNPADENSILVSRTLCDRLGIKLDDRIFVYFIGTTIQARRLTVSGIYSTNISNYDNIFIISGINMVNRLNRWEDDMVSGLEINLSSLPVSQEVVEDIYSVMDQFDSESPITLQTPETLHPDIFSWLDILDMNVLVILILMFGLSFFTIISGLLIIILEKVSMIGTLKALGANNGMIKKIFLGISSMIIFRGLVIGNLITLAIYWVQNRFHLLHLDPSVYYIDYVPMQLTVWHVILLNLVTLVFSILVLLVPSAVVSRISPTKTIRFD